MIRAIETKYKGYRFRSRLEARWAVFFDAIDLQWEYELEGFNCDGICYLPDFYLPKWKMFLEIKPMLPDDWFDRAGDTILLAIRDGKPPASYMKFMAASSGLRTRDENGTYHNGLYMLCGSPGVPSLRRDGSGIWVLRNGAVAIHKPVVNGLQFPLSAWCESSGELDLNSYYMDPMGAGGEVRSIQNKAVLWPKGMMLSLYIGCGRFYDTPLLNKAYAAARSARFEFGESG